MKQTNNFEEYIDILYELVLKSSELDEIPVGAIVINNSKIIGKGFNNRQSSCDVCGHAEINAIKDAEKQLKDWRLNECILISTLYPCDLCQSVIKESRIKDVYYIFDAKVINNKNYNKLYFPGNKKVEEMKKIFDEFFINLR